MKHISDNQLNEYLDRSLPEEFRRDVNAHLDTCESCQARLDELQFVFNRLSDLPEIGIYRDLTPGILTRLHQKQSRLLTPILAVQVVIVLGIMTWLSSEAVRLIKLPMVPDFYVGIISLSGVHPFFPNFSLNSLTTNFLLSVPKIQFLTGYPMENLPHQFNLTTMPFWVDKLHIWNIPLSHFPLASMTISALLLCLGINAALLNKPSGEKK